MKFRIKRTLRMLALWLLCVYMYFMIKVPLVITSDNQFMDDLYHEVNRSLEETARLRLELSQLIQLHIAPGNVSRVIAQNGSRLHDSSRHDEALWVARLKGTGLEQKHVAKGLKPIPNLPRMSFDASEVLKKATVIDLRDAERPPYLSKYKNPCWLESNNGQPILCEKFARGRKSEDACTTHNTTLRCLPYFMLAGFTKCGTSDLYKRLELHPQMALPKQKELRYWDTSMRLLKPWFPFSAYICNLQDSAQQIVSSCHPYDPRCTSRLIAGDGTPHVIWEQRHWKRLRGNEGLEEPRVISAHVIKHVLPQMKFVVILRDPVERLYSSYCFFALAPQASPQAFHELVVRGVASFERCQAAHNVRACCYNDTNNIKGEFSFINLHVGIYHVYFSDWLSLFPRQNFHVLRLEDYSQDKIGELDKIAIFLGLDKFPTRFHEALNGNSINNARTQYMKNLGPMLNATRDILRRFYAPHNRRLPTVLGNPIKSWGYS